MSGFRNSDDQDPYEPVKTPLKVLYVREAPTPDVLARIPSIDGDTLGGKTLREASESPAAASGNLQRKLKSRHMKMIAIGGCVGTGLFVGSGNALSDGGPASIVIAFIIVGLYVLCTTSALAELSVVYPSPGCFYKYFSRFIHPAWGFSVGIQYWLAFSVTIPLELTVAPMVINFWNVHVRASVWISIFFVILIGINFVGVKGYAEVEFALSIVKVLAVFVFIILSIIIDVGGIPNNDLGTVGLRYWQNSMAFRNGLKGFCSVLVIAVFSLSGTELVGLAAGEAQNPNKTIPKIVKQIFWRVLLFYVVGLFMMTLIVPGNIPELRSESTSEELISPFVLALQLANLRALPSIMNAVILLSTISVANSASYAAGRTLFALAKNGYAPKIFRRTTKKGEPRNATIGVLCFGCIAYVAEAGLGGAVFNWLLSLCGLSTIFIWGSICLAHLRFRKAWKLQGHTLNELLFTSKFGKLGSYYGVSMTVLCLIAQLYIALFPIGRKTNAIDFFQAYLAAPVAFFCFLFWKLYKKEERVPLDKIDLMEGFNGRITEDLETAIETSDIVQVQFSPKMKMIKEKEALVSVAEQPED
ncbi:hypothetical protein SJAG_00149 [Schizosaccharomyces japonicus yFS275]|uniref:Amino acid permease/ SLC12A domain-containing protein n=1 Tax=Schizosaccharomyces japonicus (strain yFS275 / FY16936) TaxID=402676 RepID=B6JXK7_SCHJY|nr:hypothetical protein SJAG_00149 [Schizosaccharomyces japonicus yFS275]EEB05151.1 hypothetical protein SJAG_00149 [Schizosaccharomyces japonicus yFS275]